MVVMNELRKPKVIITEPIATEAVDYLANDFEITSLNGKSEKLTKALLSNIEGIIVRNLEISRDTIEAAPQLKCIVKHGAGVDNIDVKAASDRKILVANVPGVNASAVAEATIALIVATIRRVPYVDGLVRAGRYHERWNLQFGSLFGANIGLIGCGAVGSRVGTACARGFDMNVYVYDPEKSENELQQLGFKKVDDKFEMLGIADIERYERLGTDGHPAQ